MAPAAAAAGIGFGGAILAGLTIKTLGQAIDVYAPQLLREIPLLNKWEPIKNLKTKEELAAENAEKLEKLRQKNARELEETRRQNAEDLARQQHQYRIEELEANFQNDLIRMHKQAKIVFEAKEYDAFQQLFPLRETSESFTAKLMTRLKRCVNDGRDGVQRIPAPNLFLMLPEHSQRFLFFETLELSQFTTSLPMLTSAGTYSVSGPTPYFNHIGAWKQAREFQNYDSVQTFWEVCSFYPTIILQPCYSPTDGVAQLNVYFWDVNSQETQNAPNHLTLGRMSIDDYREQLSENIAEALVAMKVDDGPRKNEIVSQMTKRGVFLFYRLMTATAVAQFIDGYYYRANGTLPQFLPALKESFHGVDLVRTFPYLQGLTQEILLNVLNDWKFNKNISNVERALGKIRKPGFFYQGEEKLAAWTRNILQDLTEKETVKDLAKSSVYVPY